MALPVAFGLAALPPELFLRVVRLLDVRSVVRLSSVCRHFHSSTSDSTLWRHLYRRDFTDPDPVQSRDTDWKQLYKNITNSALSDLPLAIVPSPSSPEAPGTLGPSPAPSLSTPQCPGSSVASMTRGRTCPAPSCPGPATTPSGPFTTDDL
ncbi:hypothetical protein INR49_007901 [Caranx melampygus]|nr:hypothetical protein INR49_007901 [Caranx melampygus]